MRGEPQHEAIAGKRGAMLSQCMRILIRLRRLEPKKPVELRKEFSSPKPSIRSIHRYLRRLEKAGFVRREEGGWTRTFHLPRRFR